jgi:uncharacterized delta-60 repeat protein
VSLRSLVSVSRRRPARGPTARQSVPAVAPAGAAIEPLETRVFLSADVLSPVADTFVRDPMWNNVNFGDSPYLYVKTAASGDDRIAFLRFDLSAYQASDIGNATLYLAGALQTPTTPAITAAIYPAADTNWVEGNGTVSIRNVANGQGGGSQLSGTSPGDGYNTDNSPAGEVTWDNQPVIVGGALATAVVNRETFQTYAFDVTGFLAQQRAIGTQFVTLAVRNVEATAHMTRFISREFSGAGRPQLVISNPADLSEQAVTATVNAPDITVGGSATQAISVTYSSPNAIDTSTIDPSDITVMRDGGGPVSVLSASADSSGGTVTVTYVLDAPGETWEVTDNDLYTVHVRAGEVRDVAGNNSNSSFGSFRAKVNDVTPPSGAISAPNVTSDGGGSYSFTITYSDNVAVDASTINISNASVITPGGARLTPRLVTLSPDDGDAGSIVATYTVDAPGGSWGTEDNGTYSVTLHMQTVRDTAANEAPEFSVSFNAAIAGTNAPPAATISSGDVTAPSSGTHTVTVLYTDDQGINSGTIDVNDISVTGPAGALAVTGVSVTPGGSGSPQTAVYTIAPPAGGWTSAANGAYTVAVNANQVADTAGSTAPGTVGGFNVSIGDAPADTMPPTATIAATGVSDGGGATHAITVNFTDNVAVDVSSIGTDDVTVTGPDGALTVTGVILSQGTNGTPLSVTYVFAAPGGSWDADSDDGAYSISLLPGAVRDTAGNVNAGVSAGFTVDIGGPDAAGPEAAITAPDVLGPGVGSQQIQIVYTDSGKVLAGTIDASDISVVRNGDNLALTVTGVAVNPPGNGSPRTAIYTVAAPGGSWDAADNGTYTVTLKPGAVADRKGNFAASASATFSVNATIVDNTPPAASFATTDVTAAGNSPHSIVVTYSDNQPIPLSTFGTDDLTVTGPGGAVLLGTNAVVTTNESGQIVTVTYEFAPPGGTWDVSDNGVYTISLKPGAVVDAAGNSATAPAGTFTVAVPAPPARDPSFGSGNPIATTFVAEGIVAQEDGKLILVGRRGNAATADTRGVIQRRNPDGTLDTTFGQGGEVVTPDANVGLVYYAVALQGNKIVVAGTMFGAIDGDFLVSRYNPDGSLDTTFGSGGRSFADFGAPGEAAYGVAVGADGKIVLGGGSADHFAFARYTADGVLDPTFGQGGKNLFDADGVDVVGAVAIQANGKVVAAGASGASVVVIRLNENGERDFGFAGDSILVVPGLRSRQETGLLVDRSQAIAIQGDGKILVGNFTEAGSNFGVVRVDAGGNVDTSFGTDGIAAVDLGGTDDVDSLVIQLTGEILAVGTTDAGGTPQTAVAALDPAGKLITGFGAGGILAFPSGVSNPSREIHIGDLVLRAFGTRQSDGRLVVASSDRSPTQTSSALTRLNVPGTRALDQGTFIWQFGNVAGSRRPVRLVDTVTGAVFTMKGGTGQAFRGEDGKINIVLTDGGAGVTVAIKARGRVNLGDIVCRGTVRSFQVKTGDLSGTFFVGGMLGKVRLGNVTGTVAATGAITSLLADNLTEARILSGASLGEDAKLGGTGSNADAFGQGVIGVIKVKGQIAGSIIGAGLNPVDGVIGNTDDTVAAGSTIRSISAKAADESSRFYASSFGAVKLPKKVDVVTDSRFRTA